jgi:hypothetical protein
VPPTESNAVARVSPRFDTPQLSMILRLVLPALLSILAACSERLEWREFRSPDGYSVSIPGRSQTVAREVEFEGRKISMSMTSTGVGPSMFAVGAARLPAGIAGDAAARERAMAYFRDGLVRNIGGTITAIGPAPLVLPPGSGHVLHASQAVQASGRAGGRGPEAVLAARFFIVDDDRLFQLIALGGEGGIEPQDLDTFFTSFRLLP